MKRGLAPIVLATLLAAVDCGHGAPRGVCDDITGMWHGEAIEPNGGSDPDAVRVVSELVHSEQWRFTRVTPTGMQRERAGVNTTHPVAEPLVIRANNARQCVMDLTSPRRSETLVVSMRPNGRMAVQIQSGWYTSLFHRP